MAFLKALCIWLKGLVQLPGNLAKVAQVNQSLGLEQELAETKNRLKKAQEHLANEAAVRNGRLFFRDNVLWAKNENGEIESAPYCSRCFELNGKQIHLIVYQGARECLGRCPECKTEVYFPK